MPINEKMMSNMQSQYGADKGKQVYYASENKKISQTRAAKGKSKAILKSKLMNMFNTTPNSRPGQKPQ
jgi:hypothetical protein